MTCWSATPQPVRSRGAHDGQPRVPDVRCSPLDRSPLEGAGRPPGLGDAQAARAPPAADAQPDPAERRAADRGLLARAPETRAAADRADARPGGVGRARRVGQGVWKVLRRHGISTRAKRLALIAGYRAPYEPPRTPEPEPRIETDRAGELVGIDCFFVGRLSDTKGAVWQITAMRHLQRLCLGRARHRSRQRPDRRAHHCACTARRAVYAPDEEAIQADQLGLPPRSVDTGFLGGRGHGWVDRLSLYGVRASLHR